MLTVKGTTTNSVVWGFSFIDLMKELLNKGSLCFCGGGILGSRSLRGSFRQKRSVSSSDTCKPSHSCFMAWRGNGVAIDIWMPT